MVDVLTKSQRSYNMSQIKAKDTKAEIKLRKALFRNGVRSYRLNYKLPGKPDLVFPKKKIAVFVDGCFWHKCPQHFIMPKTRTDFWNKKIGRNTQRDREVETSLNQLGWIVLRFWEHQIEKDIDSVIRLITKELV